MNKFLAPILFAGAALLAQPAPLTLEQATREALAQNLDLAAQRYNIPIAEAREITAGLRPNPVLTVNGQTLNFFGALYSSDSPLGPNQYNSHVDYTLERGHKREERIAVARQEKSLAELGVREMMRQVIFSVQCAFVDVQQAAENRKLAEENLQKLESVVAINETRLKAGDLALVELERSRLAAMQLQAAVQQSQLQLDQAKAQLQLIIGRKHADPAFAIAGDFRREPLLPTQDELASAALTRRPDYLAARQAEDRSRADLRLQQANAKPDLTIGAEYSYQHAFGIGGSSVGVSLSVPLPFFNKNQGEILRARREIAQGAVRTDGLRIAIQSEVDKAFRQYTVSQQLLRSVETGILAKARSVRDTTEYSYRRGEASLIEFLDAQRAFNDAVQTYIDARASYARSLFLLDSVTGSAVSGS